MSARFKTITRAVIPAAGLGTRFLPATKATPKEMLPIVDKPTIQYIVEEALASGIEDILIITGRSKRAIEDHFDRSIELELNLAEKGKEEGKGSRGIYCGSALKLHNGTIITGKNSPLMHSTSSMIINAIKALAGIPDEQHLLLPEILESVASFKDDMGSSRAPGLDVSETLIALIVSANSNPDAKKALNCLGELQQCDMHLTHVPSPGDEAGLRRLGCSYTYDPVQPSKNLFV